MDELKITRKTEPVMFTIRVDKSIVIFMTIWPEKPIVPVMS